MNTRPKLRGDRCQCTVCGELFNSTHAFDKHRTGTYSPLARRCLTVAEMTARGMSRNAAAFWIVSAMPILRFGTRETAAIGTDPLPTQGVEHCPGGAPDSDDLNEVAA